VVTVGGPSVELVRTAQRDGFIVVQAFAVESEALALADDERAAVAEHLGFASPNGNRGGVVARAHVDAVAASAPDGTGQVGRVDFDDLPAVEPSHANLQRPLR
jgi:hypothetical protein